MTTRSDSHIS